MTTPDPATTAVRTAIESDTQHGAVVPPLYLSTNFTFSAFGEPRRYDYTRSGNPTRDALGDALARLEGGAGATVTASGTAAVTLVCQLLKPGDLLLAPHDCYGGTYRLFESLASRGLFCVRFVDQTDTESLRAAFALRPRMVWVETPSNPLLRIVDLEAVAALCRRHQTLLVADNTFLSPALQQPLSLGADLVVHSTTKYLNGHSDVVGGAVVAGTPELAQEIDWWANCLGLTGAPFDSYLTLRGVRTLHARLRIHEENAHAVADLLDGHPAVARVFYPGLAQHPGHTLARRQQKGFGGMISFELRGGASAAQAFVEGMTCFSLAESLGGVESLVAHPATMTHAAMDEDARLRAGIGDGLIRLSIGIEAAQDLVADVAAGLERASSAVTRPPLAVAAAC
jgi:cystathionine gamma-synthase